MLHASLIVKSIKAFETGDIKTARSLDKEAKKLLERGCSSWPKNLKKKYLKPKVG
jgi:hypothetical protein